LSSSVGNSNPINFASILKSHLLEVDSVQKNFDYNVVLSDVYLACKTGEIIGLLGRNGSGKSTLLKIIFGILRAENKFIRIDGVVKFNNSSLFKEVSYLPQEDFIPKNLSVKKAIALSVKNQLEFCSDSMIQTLLEKKIAHLSAGELRYLEIKLILNNSSKFALLDEPYNGLSPIMIDKINNLILENSSKKGIVITDHNYQNVIAISTKLVLLKNAKAFHLEDKNQLIEMGYLKEGMM
jgi:ABC-type multidrug transport system ATPase subunit